MYDAIYYVCFTLGLIFVIFNIELIVMLFGLVFALCGLAFFTVLEKLWFFVIGDRDVK